MSGVNLAFIQLKNRLYSFSVVIATGAYLLRFRIRPSHKIRPACLRRWYCKAISLKFSESMSDEHLTYIQLKNRLYSFSVVIATGAYLLRFRIRPSHKIRPACLRRWYCKAISLKFSESMSDEHLTYIQLKNRLYSFSVVIAIRSHPFPSRTRKLSLSAPMVLHGQLCGRVGRRRNLFYKGLDDQIIKALFLFV